MSAPSRLALVPSASSRPDPAIRAAGHSYRGETDASFEWFERAYRDGTPGVETLKVEALFASLRGDPRYNSMLRKLNLPA